jgi:hypothetical protein
MTERYYISAQGADHNAMRLAFDWLVKQLQQSPTPLTGLLCVPTIRNLEGVITDVIGERMADALASGKFVRVSNSSSNIRLITRRRPYHGWRGGPILAAYPDKKILDMLDETPGVSAILAVPWLMQNIQLWIDTWAAQELRSREPTVPVVTVTNPVVIAALRSLTKAVNLSTGIHHPSDRQAAIDLFERLNDAGESYNPDEVRAWLIREGGWAPTDADDVRSIAASILAGRRIRGGGRFWADNIVEQWRSES